MRMRMRCGKIVAVLASFRHLAASLDDQRLARCVLAPGILGGFAQVACISASAEALKWGSGT